MPATIADVPVDVVRAESSRFRHPLLLLHGWWTGAWIWRGFAAYLAHRGWDVFAPSFLERGAAPDASDRVDFLCRLCETLPAPPVIVAHEAGVTTGLALARAVAVPALVAIAPLARPAGAGVLVPRADPRLWWWRTFAPRVPPPRGALGETLRAELSDDASRLVADSGRFFRSVLRQQALAAENCPARGLVVCSRNDPMTGVAAVEELAAAVDWAVDVVETTDHFPMATAGAERVADRVHRWIVRTLGAGLLAFLDEEEPGP